MKQSRGFTIVELLVVIVVIAILASITVVAYNGIQGRAKEVAIRSDLSNFAKAAELYHLDHSSYPNPQDNVDNLQALNFRASHSVYPSGFEWNFDYYTDRLDGNTQYILIAMVDQTNALYVSSNNSNPKEIAMPTGRPDPSPCYNDATPSAAADAGLTNINSFPLPNVSGGVSGYGPGGWREWTK